MVRGGIEPSPILFYFELGASPIFVTRRDRHLLDAHPQKENKNI